MSDGDPTIVELKEELAKAKLQIAELLEEKKQREENNKPQADRTGFDSLFESPMMGTIFWNAEGDITDANDKFLDMVGFTRDEVLSGDVRWKDMTPPEYAENDQVALEELAETGTMAPMRKENYRKDGSRIPVLVGASVLPGTPLRGVAFVLDITEQRKAEKRLEQEISAVNTIIDNILNGDNDDQRNEKLVLEACMEATDSTYGMIGKIGSDGKHQVTSCDSRDVPGSQPPDVVALDLSEGIEIQGIWKWPLKHGEPLLCNDLDNPPEGVEFVPGHVEIDCFLGIPLKQGEKVFGMVAVANRPGKYTELDLDTLQRLAAIMSVSQQQRDTLLQSRLAGVQLEATNKELEGFVYSISHDLKAPLRSMDGFSRVLEENYSDKLDEQGLDYLGRVRRAALKMGNLIDDIMTLSRVARREMKFEEVDLSAVARSLVGDFAKKEPQRNVELLIHKDLETQGDPALLRTVLENLLGNAWKFSGKQESAKVEFGQIEIDGKETFFVRDNGAGFDMTYASKLFGVFQRLHADDEFPGTGVGLATVFRIVARHGGRIWAEAEEGKGATFYFTFGNR